MLEDNSNTYKLTKWFNKEFFYKQLVSPFGITLLSLIAIGAGYLAYKGLAIFVILIAVALAGAIVVYYCFFQPLTGYYLVTFMAFFAFYPNHLFNREFPISTVIELLLWFVFLGSYREKKKLNQQKNSLLYTGISVVLIIYSVYHVIQFFNPNMLGKAGYFFIIRKFTVFIFLYVMAYRLINTPKKFRFFVKFWLIMSFICALYGCYQQWFGYLPMELRYIKSSPIEYKLMFQGGVLRKYSFLSDVVSFGVLSGSMALITIIVAINQKDKKRKYLMFAAAVVMMLGMSYSGTRTTNVILPAGMALYLLMTIRSRTTLITLFLCCMGAFFILFAPIDNPSLNRIRSTFRPENASLNVRDANRHYIQPYIYAHPIGGGLATAGVPGRRFNPGHFLAGFPPDSGLLQIALEMGWVGLALTILFYLMILYQCIYFYFKIKNPEYKTYAVAFAAALFAIMITQYSQVTIGQIPLVFFYMSSISLVKRLMEFDNSEQLLKAKQYISDKSSY